jgi:hypothetical protein
MGILCVLDLAFRMRSFVPDDPLPKHRRTVSAVIIAETPLRAHFEQREVLMEGSQKKYTFNVNKLRKT